MRFPRIQLSASLKSTRRRQRGVAAVEFAFVALPLIALMFGVTELGRAIYSYDTLAKSVRAGARYLSFYNAGDASAITAAKNLVVYGQTTEGSTPLLPGLTTAMVDVCDASNANLCPGVAHASVPSCYGGTCTGVVNMVTVRVTAYPFQSLASFFVPNMTFGSSADSTGVSATMRQDL